MNITIGILIPFLGTTLGAACVLFMQNELRPRIQKALLGFASGVMVAASVWKWYQTWESCHLFRQQ